MKSMGYKKMMMKNKISGQGNQKMTGKLHKCVMVGLLILALSLVAQSAKALPITEIAIPMTAAVYDIDTHAFSISGLSTVKVFYENSPTQSYKGMFGLDTAALDWHISNDGTTITYSRNSPAGKIDLLDASAGYSSLLLGELDFLEMTIVDPVLGVFEGMGSFSISGGDLAEEFGDNGGLATIGIAFQVPFDFSNSFTAMANTKVYPSSIPDATTLVLLGSAMLIGGVFGRKKA